MCSYDDKIKMDDCYEVSEYDDSASCDLFDIKDIPNLLSSCDETITPSGLNINMTSLSALMLLSQSNEKTSNDALNQEFSKRLSFYVFDFFKNIQAYPLLTYRLIYSFEWHILQLFCNIQGQSNEKTSNDALNQEFSKRLSFYVFDFFKNIQAYPLLTYRLIYSFEWHILQLFCNIQGQSNEKTSNDALNQEFSKRLSLAYERLRTIPKILKQEFAPNIQILDISNNDFDNLLFLKDFKKLTSLICDHNNITSKSEAPYLPNLELLWLNHCKIHELYPWAVKLSQSCPNIKYLSLMGNLAAPSYLNGGTFYDHLQYRAYIISLFPKLIHLDDRIVNAYQRREAERRYRKPFVHRLVPNKPAHYFPEYFRTISGKLNNILTSTPQFVVSKQKNTIV